MAKEDPEVYRITSAQPGQSVDTRARTRNYLISMAIRTVCVILAALVPGPARWLFIFGAVVLPYLAVVMANAGHERKPDEPLPTFTVDDLKALPPGPRVSHDNL